MLYPKEDRTNRVLLFACRNCDHQEEANNYCVYRHDIILPAMYYLSYFKLQIFNDIFSEQSRSYSDFPSDPTLPRTNKRPCPKCKYAEAVFFQTHDRRRDTPMTLNFVCCNSTCNHVWNEVPQGK